MHTRTRTHSLTTHARTQVRRRVAPGAEGICIDHPHVNPLYEGKAECRYVYASISNEIARAGPPCGYVRVDVKSGTREVWWAGNRTFCEELVVVPKADCRCVGAGAAADAIAQGTRARARAC